MVVREWIVALGACMFAAATHAASPAGGEASRLARQGLVVDFSAKPLAGAGSLTEQTFAEVRFTITDETTGQPVRGLAPGAWMDIADSVPGRGGAEQKSCKDKIALYLKGVVGIRPMVDLNSYYVVVLNREASLTVIDPTVSMAGRTSTLAQIALPRPGADWAQHSDAKRLYVTMPAADRIAVIDTDTFKLVTTVASGATPTRVTLQPDGRYLWVGNNGHRADQSGFTVIDTDTLQPVAAIATGAGHHEIALSADSAYALVTNRDDASAVLIDVRTLKPIRRYELGGVPISTGYSRLSKAFYVADGRNGIVHVLRPDDAMPSSRIAAKPGLGPMRFATDGRWLLVVNTSEDLVHVIDPAINRIVHDIPVAGQPFQLAFTRLYAYVRALGSERVGMIELATLGAGKTPTVLSFAAGAVPPKAASEVAMASSMSPAATEAGVLVVNPADNTTYFYMEGMNAASSNYKAYGASARAVTVIDRSLREIEPGVYAASVKVPAAGRYDVAFSLDSPRLLHCFSTYAERGANAASVRNDVDVRYLLEDRDVRAATTQIVRFRIVDKASGSPLSDVADAKVMWYRAPGRDRAEIAATPVGDGLYEAALAFPVDGAYYIHVASRSLHKDFRDLPFVSVIARQPSGVASASSQ